MANVKLEITNREVAKYKKAMERWMRTARFFEQKVGGAYRSFVLCENFFSRLIEVPLPILEDLLDQKYAQADWLWKISN